MNRSKGVGQASLGSTVGHTGNDRRETGNQASKQEGRQAQRRLELGKLTTWAARAARSVIGLREV